MRTQVVATESGFQYLSWRGVSRETLLRKKYFAAKAEMVRIGGKLTPSRQRAIQFMSTRPSSELLQGMEALGQRD